MPNPSAVCSDYMQPLLSCEQSGSSASVLFTTSEGKAHAIENENTVEQCLWGMVPIPPRAIPILLQSVALSGAYMSPCQLTSVSSSRYQVWI